ncbi:putative pre-mRNA splicing factor [Xylariaceae sp. FL0255]|nr:putative pre-mRNA splicing factor [Xylariaceae sp. FL0255]
MANPVGEDNWLAYIEEQRRHATDLETRVKVVELFKAALADEPQSLDLWLSYCEYFWSLFNDSSNPDSSWSDEEKELGRELFAFDQALGYWNDGYDATKFRIADSHRFWDRWIAIELGQLARAENPVGIKRISHLFRDRLQVPHATWDQTSQMFSQFLTTYNNAAYESEMQDVTRTARDAKAAYEPRERFELDLARAQREKDRDAEATIMRRYLEWEVSQTTHAPPHDLLTISLGLGLYSRALTGIFSLDDTVWNEGAIYLSTLHRERQRQSPTAYRLPDTLDFLQRATKHCPWSGPLWSRYILTAEAAGLPFYSVESIKHAATNTKALDKNGMTGVLDMYTAWCGFLKRTAMDPNASEDAADVAELGLLAALEDVSLWGKRLYKDAYQGDPNYRLERILIQFLTEVKSDVDGAREHWNKMTQQTLLANSYDFWLNYYLWEMVIFASKPKLPCPTPPTPSVGSRASRIPSMATGVLQRALASKGLDWPERIMEVYLQHCNDYEQPDVLHFALDTVHNTRRLVAERREHETAQAQAAYAAQIEQAGNEAPAAEAGSPSNAKRKREDGAEDAGDAGEGASKKARSTEPGADGLNGTNESDQKRDRENTSVLVTNLPFELTKTALKKYFKEYGHMNNIELHQEEDKQSSTALIEFSSHEEAVSALLRDQKYLGESQITVKPGTNLTIYVSNYPPTADEAYIRNLFKKCGDIFSVRFPSLRFNTHRRFCYVSFRDQEASYKATLLDGTLIEGKFKLQSKYSNPKGKKDREGIVAEKREVRVKGVPSGATEDELRSVFSNYGKVVSVRILTNMGGKNVGTAFVVFETKEQTEKALELDKTKFKSEILIVELCKESNFKPIATTKGDHGSAASSPAPSADGDLAMMDDHSEPNGRHPTPREIQQRTIAIMDLPDTVNDARVRALVEKHGAVVKLVLRPDHAGAIIEFADASMAGHAALALEGTEIDFGHKIRTGSVQELFHGGKDKGDKQGTTTPASFKTTASSSKNLMLPPPNVRRPMVLGRGGKKRGGLGFVAMARSDNTQNKKEDTPK